ncbi:acyltransferase family protein [Novosphingobium soli]|uniref:Acyltransferase family protein n=1 Tax=Novosphingobium soli TaxID=574956 RepID=A0ABV6CZE0_9SPHN
MTRGAPPVQLHALTGIRGVAAWLVVFYHLRLSLTALLPAPVIGVLAKGYLAVDMFFVLSGFVMWHSYAPRLAQGGRGEVGRFLWRRFARVWPLHAAVLAAFVAFAGLLAATGRESADYPWRELPLHVLLLQNWGFTGDLAWNDPAWSISAEMAAYLVFPGLVAVLARVGGGRGRQLALAPLLAALLVGGVGALFAAQGHRVLGADITGLGLWRCLFEFTLGCVTCLAWSAQRAAGGAGAWPAWCALAAVLALAWATGAPETLAVPAALACGLLALARDCGPVARMLGSRPLRWLGDISYATYLAHVLLFILFKIAFVDAGLQLGWGELGGFVALLLAVSTGLYHGLEKPAQRWLNRHPPLFAVPAERPH